MKSEAVRQRSIIRTTKLPDTKLMRNNVGAAKIKGFWVKFGLGKGSSDLIGYTKVKITPGMVGREIAVFTACEVKKPGGKTSIPQQEFIASADDAGGIALIVECVDDVIQGIKRWKSQKQRRNEK